MRFALACRGPGRNVDTMERAAVKSACDIPFEFAFLCGAVSRALGFRGGDRGGGENIPDMQGLTQLAIRHHCLPLLAKGMECAGGGACTVALAPEIRERWARHLAGGAGRALFLTRRMRECLDGFARAGICALAWKGPVLSQWLYGHVECRPTDDIDIWVHPRDFVRACEQMEELGFVPLTRLSAVEAVAHCRAGWDRGFRSPDGDYVVELCVGMAPQYFARLPDPDAVLASAADVAVDGVPARTLSGDLLMEQLCVHGMKHGWTRLLWVADVAALSVLQGQGAVDWAALRARTNRNGTGRMVALGLHLARLHLNSPVEWESVPHGLAGQANRLLYGGETCRGFRAEFRWYSRGCRRWRDRVRYLFLVLCTPSFGDWRAIRLPARLFWLHWFLRPFRLLVFGRRQSLRA